MSNYNDMVAEREAEIQKTGIGLNIELSKEEIWMRKRAGKITASVCPDLMTKGTKGAEWGQTALKALYAVKYERRTGLIRESFNNSNFDWGHENEENAIEWLKSQTMQLVKSCSNDFDEIVFQQPIDGFGDSPDAFIYDFNEKTIDAVVEIKCPVNVGKIEEFHDLKEIDEKSEYYWQFIAHFIGTPTAKRLVYVVYDGYANDGLIFEMQRADHLINIDLLQQRITKANKFIDRALAGEILSEIIKES